MAETRVHASISVFRGEPLDYQQWRHTALHFRFEGGEAPVTIHAVGTQGHFAVEIRGNYAPDQSERFAKEVPVGWLEAGVDQAAAGRARSAHAARQHRS